MFQILHFSDCHLFAAPNGEIGGVRSADALAATVTAAQAGATTSRLAIITGDLSQDGTPESYERAEQLFARLGMPVYAVPGNHDRLVCMQTALTGHPIVWQRSVVVAGWQMVFLNSTLTDPDNPAGLLPAEELSSLEDALLAQPGMPTLVALHHQPMPLDTPWMNRMALTNPDDLFTVLARHPWVRALLFGHIHYPFAGERQGIHLLSAPSTCVQFATGTTHPVFVTQTAGCRWLRLYPDGHLATGIVWI
ncbi:MAG: phosphodiesterase [Magnetococcus sp. DMHC-8]